MSVINLNKARKAKERAEAQAKAAENRIRFGRTRVEKLKTSAETERSARDLDGHRREGDD
jgi:hypothetical protein